MKYLVFGTYEYHIVEIEDDDPILDDARELHARYGNGQGCFDSRKEAEDRITALNPTD